MLLELLPLLPNNRGSTSGCYRPVWRDFLFSDWKDAGRSLRVLLDTNPYVGRTRCRDAHSDVERPHGTDRSPF